MSRRMKFLSLPSLWLWIVGAMLVVSTLKAEPPQPRPLPSLPESSEKDVRQIQFHVKVWDIDHAKLKALTKSELGVHEFYKANGLIKQPDWISAAIGDAVNDLPLPPGAKPAAPKPLPLRATAVRREAMSMTLLGQDIASACKVVAEPSLVATSGREASLLSGGEIPILIPRTGDPEVTGWIEFGVKMKVLGKLLNDNSLSLHLDFADSERNDPSAENGDSSVSLVHRRGFELGAQMKLGERLLVAQQTGKQETTRLVEIQAERVAEVATEKTNVPAAAATDSPAKALPQKVKFTPPQPVAREAAQIQIEAVIYAVDPGKLMKLAGQSKLPVEEFLKANGFALDQGKTARPAFLSSIREQSPSFLLNGQDVSSAFRQRATETTVVSAGTESQLLTSSPGRDSTLSWRELGTQIVFCPIVEADGRIRIEVDVVEARLNKNALSDIPRLKSPVTTHKGNFQATIKSGQHLLLANGTSESNFTQLIVFRVRGLTAEEISKQTVHPYARPATPASLPIPVPARAIAPLKDHSQLGESVKHQRRPNNEIGRPIPNSKVTKNDDGTITVEDRWPIEEIEVGQRVVIAPTVIGKNDLQVRYEMLGAFLIQLDEAPQKSSPFEVRRIESLPGGNGRRVTIGLHFEDENGQEQSEFDRESEEVFLGMVRDVTTCVVIPDQEIGFLQYSWLDRLAKALPAELRPRPRELFVGDSVCAPNVIAPMADRDAADLGALEVRTESEDDEKITCSIRGNKPGLARVVHFFGSNKTDKATLFRTEFLVKADTRELEHHIQQQFPMAKVAITSLGTNSLILNGKAASDDDSHGIMELAEQFAPKVLSRLKVGAADASSPAASNEPRRMGTPARPIFVQSSEPQIAGEPSVPKIIQEGTGKSAHPPRVQPASATSSKKTDQLRELLDEIRELRQEVRTLNERLEREHPVTDKTEERPKASSPLGEERSESTVSEFDKLVMQFNESMEQKRFAEAEVIGKKAKGLDSKNPVAEVILLKAQLARRNVYANKSKSKQEGHLDEQKADKPLVIVTYSVADLIVPAPPLQVRIRDGKAATVKEPEPIKPGVNSWNQLRDLITSTIAPTSWEEVGGNGQMKFNDSTLSLIVRQSQAVHDELRSLLKQLRTMQDQQVSLEFWLIKTDEIFHGFGFDLPAGWTTLKADEHQLLNPKQTAAMIKAANGTNRVSIFGLPKVTLLSGQQLGCEFVNESLPTALHIAGAAVQSPNRDFVRLHLSANNSLQTMKRAGVTAFVKDGHSVLLNITHAATTGKQEGIPILEKVPNQSRLFKNVKAKNALTPGESLFLLTTSRVIAQDAEESSLGTPQ